MPQLDPKRIRKELEEALYDVLLNYGITEAEKVKKERRKALSLRDSYTPVVEKRWDDKNFLLWVAESTNVFRNGRELHEWLWDNDEDDLLIELLKKHKNAWERQIRNEIEKEVFTYDAEDEWQVKDVNLSADGMGLEIEIKLLFVDKVSPWTREDSRYEQMESRRKAMTQLPIEEYRSKTAASGFADFVAPQVKKWEAMVAKEIAKILKGRAENVQAKGSTVSFDFKGTRTEISAFVAYGAGKGLPGAEIQYKGKKNWTKTLAISSWYSADRWAREIFDALPSSLHP
jgi:hypothetical protein